MRHPKDSPKSIGVDEVQLALGIDEHIAGVKIGGIDPGPMNTAKQRRHLDRPLLTKRNARQRRRMFAKTTSRRDQRKREGRASPIFDHRQHPRNGKTASPRALRGPRNPYGTTSEEAISGPRPHPHVPSVGFDDDAQRLVGNHPPLRSQRQHDASSACIIGGHLVRTIGEHLANTIGEHLAHTIGEHLAHAIGEHLARARFDRTGVNLRRGHAAQPERRLRP